MSLLTIVQGATDEIGIPRPVSVSGSSDQTTRQLMALANREGKQLAARHAWTALQTEGVITTTAAEDQGALSSLLPGFDRFINRSEWDRSKQSPLGGPVSPQYWQQLKAVTALGPFYSFRVRGGRFLMIPAPPAGVTIGLEYVTKYWATNAAGASPAAAFAQDTDAALLDEDLIQLGLIWRWKQAKGFDFADDQALYEERVMNAIGRDGGKRVLDMAEPGGDRLPPQIQTPEGSWNL
jgi:hypothetical protein